MASSLKNHLKVARRNKFITPKLHGWLSQNPDGIKTDNPDIQKRILEILKPSVGDRSGAFHPSQLYQCPRAQVFGYLNIPVTRSYNPTLQNLFNDGHFRHLRWQVMLLSAGILTDVEVPVAIPESRLTGSMDGVNADEGWMFELKGTSQFKTIMYRGALPAHIKQVNAYMLASGLEKTIIVYECKSSQDWTEIEVGRDETIINEISNILTELNGALDNNTLPEVKHDCKNQTGSEFNSCPYSSICNGVKSTEQAVAFGKAGSRDSSVERPKRRVVRVHRSVDGKS